MAMLSGDRYHRRRTEAVTEHSKRAIADLEKSGYLRKEQRWRENGARAATYIFKIRDGVTLKNLILH